MKFRNLIALLIVLLIGFTLFQAMNVQTSSGQLAVNKFGKAQLSNRTSAHYLAKDVNGKDKEVIYGQTSNAESGSANIVTSVVVNYRSFDTLGEVTVLFLAVTALSAILSSFATDKKLKVVTDEGSLILTRGVKIVFPLLLLLGAYIFIHGHLTPGGGFQGGAIIVTAFLLFFFAIKEYSVNHHLLEVVEALSGAAFVVIGLIGLANKGSFLANFLPTGTIGDLLSAGIIPLIYVVIGLKVGAELTGVINNLAKA